MRQFSLRVRSPSIAPAHRPHSGVGISGFYLNEYRKTTESRRTEMCSGFKPPISGIQLRDGR